MFGDDREVGAHLSGRPLRGHETWFWGISFELTRKRSYGNVMSLEEAKAAFRAEYEAWQRETGTLT
jgi:hypothetical protein